LVTVRYDRAPPDGAFVACIRLLFYFLSDINTSMMPVLGVRRLHTMRTCSYCGKHYPEDAEVCVVDQQPLAGPAESQPQAAPASAACPQCGAEDDFRPVVDVRSSFSLPAFLFGGLIAVLFRNAGKSRPVRCNKCQTRFYISSPLSKISRVIFWLLVAPSIILLGIALIVFIRNLFSN
jgi:hypothetical protein